MHSLDYFSNISNHLSENQKLMIQTLIKQHPNFIPLIEFKKNIPSVYNVYKQLMKNDSLMMKQCFSDPLQYE